jgi:biopolymer transport protein TolR
MSMSLGAAKSRGKGKRRGRPPEINVTPLVDVMLVLLIIFMITIQAAKDSIPMELPQAEGEVSAKEGATPTEVSIDEYSYVHVGSSKFDLSLLASEMPRLLRGKEKEPLLLNAHRKLSYDTVVKVVAAIRSAGVETINLAVDGQ